MKPAAAKAVAKQNAPKGAAPVAPTVLSNSLKFDLDAMAARATQDALKADKFADPITVVLAAVVAAQIMPDRMSYIPSQVRDALAKIRDGITPAVMAEALQRRFDVKRYFPNAPKTLVLKAISEAVGPEHAKKLTAGTKAAAWKFAIENVPKTGWLPRELRTAHYAGPGASKEKAPKSKTAAKKPAAKNARAPKEQPEAAVA